MSTHDDTLTEWSLRVFAVLAYGAGVTSLFLAWWADPARWTLLILLVVEGYTVLLLLIARHAALRDLSPWAIALVTYAAFYYALLDPQDTRRVIPEYAGVGLQVAGTVCQLAAKIAIGRSFGLLPADRGIVTGGLYRVVRHPVYLGYLIGHVGFVLVNFSWRNLAVFGGLYVVQVLRIRREEAVLACQDAYRVYQREVRWRLVPFIY